MDSDIEYTVAKSIVRSGQLEEEWEALRHGKGDWPVDDLRKGWKQFRLYSIKELKDMMKAYEKIKTEHKGIHLFQYDYLKSR